MRIVADNAIPYVTDAFAPLGDVTCVPGAAIGTDVLQSADVLLTRSVTRVDAELLAGTGVRFVASATAGTDHVDIAALEGAGIGFAHAPGCNARAVAEWALACIWRFWWGRDRAGAPTRRPVVGVVGYGNVGRRLTRRLELLDCEVRACDPPLADHSDRSLYDLDDLIDTCDVLTLHVPLTTGGAHPTRHLLDRGRLERLLRRPTLLINAARGAVVDNEALLTLGPGFEGRLALDTWEDEPALRWGLLNDPRILQTTAHIAGYSLDAKVRGTRLVHEAVCRFAGVEPTWTGAEHLPTDLALPFTMGDDPDAVRRDLLVAIAEIERDTAALQQLLTLKVDARPPRFEALRRDYPLRRELAAYASHPHLRALQQLDD